jgi:hydrogenase maturation protease
MARRIAVIGVGNLLLQDEGVGVHVVQELRKRTLPPEVEVLDGGVAGIGLLDFLPGVAKVLIIDAADMQLEPGTVVRFRRDEVQDMGGRLRFSTHDVGLLEVLELARAVHPGLQEVVILGIQPKEISWGTDLTPEVEAAVPKVVEAIWNEIADERASEKLTEGC